MRRKHGLKCVKMYRKYRRKASHICSVLTRQHVKNTMSCSMSHIFSAPAPQFTRQSCLCNHFWLCFCHTAHPQTKMLWQLSEMTSPRSEHGRIGLHCGPFIWLHASLFVRGTLFGEVRLLLLVASVVLVKSVSLFVAGAIFGEVGVSAMTG